MYAFDGQVYMLGPIAVKRAAHIGLRRVWTILNVMVPNDQLCTARLIV